MISVKVSETKKPPKFMFRASRIMVPRLGVATYGDRQGHEDFQLAHSRNEKPQPKLGFVCNNGAQTRSRNLR